MIAAVTLAFIGVAALFDLRAPAAKISIAELRVMPVAADNPLLGLWPNYPEVSDESAASRVAALADDPEVLARARRRLGDALPAGYRLEDHVQAAAAPGPLAGSVHVAARDGDIRRTQAVANAVAAELVAVVTARERARLAHLLDVLRDERRRLRRAADDDPVVKRFALAEFDRALARLEAMRRTRRPATVVDRADLGKRDKTVVPHVVPASVLGLSLGLLAAFFLDAVQRRPRQPERLAAAAGLPLLGLVPGAPRRRRAAYEHVAGQAAWLAGRPGPATLLVASAEPSAGKSTLALGLAQAAARAGRRTCLVECDLHRPVLAARLGHGGPGLGEWLAGAAQAEEAVRRVAGAEGEELAVVPAGRPPAGRRDLLAGEAFAAALASLRDGHDLVVCDAPPLLAVSDALALLAHADALVLCARAGQTAVDELEAVRAMLDRLPRPLPAALVVTGVGRRAPVAVPAGIAAEPRTGEA